MTVPRWVPATIVVLVVAAASAWWMRDRMAAAPQADVPTGTVLQTVRSGDVAITVSSEAGTLRTGDNRFRIEFRSTGNNELVDVGTVTLNANMTMPGMAMNGLTLVSRGERPGVYEVTSSFGMSGSWDMTLDWNGPAGRGSAAFKGSVQ